MGEPEESKQAPPPHVTVELETLRRTVLELQTQLATATTLATYEGVQAVAMRELWALAHYIDMIQVLELAIDHTQRHIDRLSAASDPSEPQP